MRRGRPGRKGISVMFMAFIAICILTTVFIVYYLHLVRASALAAGAQRMYAEAAQERLEAYYDGLRQEIVVTNRGGVGVALAYLVESDRSSGCRTDPPRELGIPLPSNETVTIPYSRACPNGLLKLVTERGSVILVGSPSPEGAVTGPVSISLPYGLISMPPLDGLSATIPLTVSASEGYSGRAFLGIERRPDPFSASLSQDEVSLQPGGSAQVDLTITSSSEAAAGGRLDALIYAIAEALGYVARAGLAILVGDFEAAFSPNPLSLPPGGQGTSELIATSSNYESEMRINVIRSDVEYQILGDAEFYLERGGSRATPFAIIAPGEEGTYSLEVEVVDGRTGYSKTAILTVEVVAPGIRLEASEQYIRVPRGGSSSTTIYAYSEGGYSGDVTLRVVSVTPDPRGRLSFSFNPETVHVTPDQPGQSTLTVAAQHRAWRGVYEVTIVGEDAQQGIVSEPLIIYVEVV